MAGKAIRHAALLAAAGFWIFNSVPSHAASGSDDPATVESPGKPLSLGKPGQSPPRKVSRARSVKIAALKAGKHKAARAPTVKTAAKKPADIPAVVANANAEMSAADLHGEAIATTAPATPLESAANDQLTELGRSLAETPTGALPPDGPMQVDQSRTAESGAVASVEDARPAAPQARTAASQEVSKQDVSNNGSQDPWAQSSLIGKVFIAFGGMLTLASAARMLIA